MRIGTDGDGHCPADSRAFVMSVVATLVGLMALGARAGEDLLIPAKGKDGKASRLHQKVVVTSDYAKLCKSPGGKGDPIEAYAIFYKLKTPSGGEEDDGWVRVGNSKGDERGGFSAPMPRERRCSKIGPHGLCWSRMNRHRTALFGSSGPKGEPWS